LRGVLCTGFAFMLRSSEFLSRGSAGWDWGKILRGCDLSFKENGIPLQPHEVSRATEVTVFLRQAKADQYNEGQVLTHHLADQSVLDLCVVRALRDMALLFPERLTTEAHLPFFRWSGGDAVTRDEVRKPMATAALRHGMPANVLTVHSLRAGGVSALYHATGGNINVVKRLGRWASEAFEGYLWEDRTLTKGLTTAMIAAPWHVHSAAY